MIARWLGTSASCEMHEGVSAFEALDDCDLLVLMGLHWTGMTAEWAGSLPYHPLEDRHKQAFEAYIGSGRPVVSHHGAIASYDDWPRFGELIGFTWVWGETTHSPLDSHQVRVLPTGHPITAGVGDFDIYDELYYNIRIIPGLNPTSHAAAEWDGADHPMILTAEGGRIAGAGHTVYLANGHDLHAFESPEMCVLWTNTVRWLLDT